MIKNHIAISLRNLWKNKTLSLLNLIGLSIGLSSALTLLFSVYAYFIADDPIPNKDQIVYLKTHLKNGDDYNEAPYPLMEKVVSSSPDVVAATHIHGWGNIWLESEGKDYQNRTDYADPEFFEVFDMPFKYGNSETALKEKYSIVLTDKVSKQMFGDVNPVGKTLIGADTLNLRITGVLQPISPYSAFRLGVILPNTVLKSNPIFKRQMSWDDSFSPVYFKLKADADRSKLKSQVTQIANTYFNDPAVVEGFEIMPFKKSRTDSIPIVDVIINASIVASFFIVLIILVNLLNLNSSTMLSRTRTIAIRKVLGSSKKNVIVQYCVENGLLVLTSLFISGFLFFGINLPRLNDIFGPEFGRISFDISRDYPVVLGIILMGIIATIVVSVLPSLRFVKIPVTLGIKGKFEQVKRNFLLRNSFIILQFSIAILCICVSIILNRQISFMKNADLGFERNNVIVGSIDLDYKNLDLAKSKFNSLLNTLEASPYVKSVSTSQAIPSDYYFNYSSYHDPERNVDVRMRRSYADDSYFNTLQVPIVKGRNFDVSIDKPKDFPVIINEAAMKAFGWTSIEGKRLKFKGSSFIGYPIVGVVKDFHYQDLQNRIEPLAHIYTDRSRLENHRFLTVSVYEGQETYVENIIASAFKTIPSRKQYLQERLTDKVSGQYQLIEGILQSVNITAILAIFISCLGLFGLISFSAKRKVKEIGVRKVLGASLSRIVFLLSKDYIILIGIAAIIALPLGGYIMSSWLKSFAFSISLQWWMFALAAIIAFVITSFTLSIRALKAAMANPVHSIKTE